MRIKIWHAGVIMFPYPLIAATVHRWESKKDHWQDPEVQAESAALPHTRSKRSPETGVCFSLFYSFIPDAIIHVEYNFSWKVGIF